MEMGGALARIHSSSTAFCGDGGGAYTMEPIQTYVLPPYDQEPLDVDQLTMFTPSLYELAQSAFGFIHRQPICRVCAGGPSWHNDAT